MSDLPEVKLRSLVNFPINAVGRTGITATKDAGRIYLDLNYKDFQITPSIPEVDMPNAYNLIWNEVEQTFAKVPFALQATAGVASIGGGTGAIVLDGTLALTGPSLGVVGGSQIYDTRASVAAASIPAIVTSILVRRYESDDPVSDAPYTRGAGSESFTDDLGNTWSLDLSGRVVKSRWFQVKGDGVTDDTTKLNLAAAASDGKALLVEGICGLTARVVLPDNIILLGHHNANDGFLALGSSSIASGLLYSNNKTGTKIRNLGFYGNLVEPAAFSIGAINFDLDFNGSAADMANIEISGCYFTNFKHSAWIGGIVAAQVGATSQIRNVRVFNNFFNATSASATTNAISGIVGSCFCYFLGNTQFNGVDKESTDSGTISGVHFKDNMGLGFGLDSVFAAVFNVRDITVTGNSTRYIGHDTLAANLAYTYMIYNSAPLVADPQNIIFSNNASFEGKANGVYFAGPRNVVCTGNVMSFITPGSNLGLPQGAGLAFNGVSQLTCTGNVLIGNVVGIAYYQRYDLANHDIIANNTIVTGASTGSINACGIRLVPDALASASDSLSALTVDSNNINVLGAQGDGISILPTYQFGRVKITNNSIKSVWNGINCSGTVLAKELRFAGNSISGQLANAAYNIVAGSSPVYVENELADFSEVVAGSSGGVFLDACTKITINGLTLANKSSGGEALSMIGTRGRCKNVTFPGTTSTRVAATSSGLSAPGWTGEQFDTWQNFQSSFYTETGSTPKYTLESFVWSTGTTWLERRFPTGN